MKRVLLSLLFALLLQTVGTGPVWAGASGEEITLDDLDDKSLTLNHVNPLRLPGRTYDDKAHQTLITGYAVASYRFNDNGVAHGHGTELHFGQDAANTTRFGFDLISVGFTKRFSDYAWVAAAFEIGLHDNASATNTELDVGEIHLVAPVGNGIDFNIGKFNSPVSFEQEDAPLLLQASHSLTYQFGSPAKMSGVLITYPIQENLEIRGAVYNGWDRNAGDGDNNKVPSFMVQVGYAPTQWADFRFSFLRGAEVSNNEDDHRNVWDLVATLTPGRNWIVGIEANYGFDENQSNQAGGGPAEWYTGQVTVHRDFTRNFGTTVRYSIFDDRDGHPDIHSRAKRTMNEITIAPVFHISPEFLGYLGFGVIPRTQHMLSGIDLRLEYRYDWINEPENDNRLFSDVRGGRVNERNMFVAEVVASF
ncbi:MAG: hypothetical protein COV67_05475 [Nitrospinae bacterium CG11_big_fil_rev_8_21_14_0_20_56_8]|nr:MAG: hypothetical protein COV67_05475 [Nitrospinae bacterium CG11_big_fil_rev_8_21_14_0_20_56_8]